MQISYLVKFVCFLDGSVCAQKAVIDEVYKVKNKICSKHACVFEDNFCNLQLKQLLQGAVEVPFVVERMVIPHPSQ